MVTGVTRIEHSREGFFVMAQVPMHHVNAEVEKQQSQRHRQPLQRLHLLHGAPECGDGQQAEQQHKGAVQPRVVERMDVGAVTAAECFGGLPHCNHLSLLLSPAD
ncbi:hypothetical protein D3C86_930970 [compost metagenome]